MMVRIKSHCARTDVTSCGLCRKWRGTSEKLSVASRRHLSHHWRSRGYRSARRPCDGRAGCSASGANESHAAAAARGMESDAPESELVDASRRFAHSRRRASPCISPRSTSATSPSFARFLIGMMQRVGRRSAVSFTPRHARQRPCRHHGPAAFDVPMRDQS